MKTKKDDKPKRSKFLLLGLGVGVLALGGLGYWYFVGRKGVATDNTDEDIIKQLSENNTTETPKPKPKTKPTPPKTTVTSPPKDVNEPASATMLLKKGSKGSQVKQLQEALIKKYGKSILPKYGIDGDFGSEVENALKSKGFPIQVDLATFNKIVSPEGDATPVLTNLDAESKDAIDIAKNIWLNSTTKKLLPLVDSLKRIKDVNQYVKVNELFKTIRLDGVRQTIVNGTLSSFDDETSKQFLKNEFIRMGLKYDGEKWSLSGITGRKIQTTQKTIVFGIDGTNMEVPEQTVLGFVQTRGRFNTRFRTLNNQTLYVPTKHIRYV